MEQSLKPDIRVFNDQEKLFDSVAKAIVEEANINIKSGGIFSIALSGGNTPSALYTLLGDKYREQVQWESVHIFWGDERFVPKEHSKSNYQMAFKTLLSKVPIPKENIHRIQTENRTPADSAKDYEGQIKDFFKSRVVLFDLVLLGVGEDGHTASLFPNEPLLEKKGSWVESVTAPEQYEISNRVTLTLNALNLSRKIFFIVSGKGKREIVKKVLQEYKTNKRTYPSSRMNPVEELVWFLDEDAYDN